jgi:hypothetical protein
VIKPTRHELSVNKYKLPENKTVPTTIKLADTNKAFEVTDWPNKATTPLLHQTLDWHGLKIETQPSAC